MLGYISKRVALTLPVLLGVAILVFFMLHLIPGDPVDAMTSQVRMSAQHMEQLRQVLGLNDPLPVQLARYLGRLARGDLGRSIRGLRPVSELIATQLPRTIELTAAGMTIALLIGVPLGLLAAARQNSFWDVASMSIAMVGVSIPAFWLGLQLIQLFAVKLGWFPATGQGSLRAVVLPALTLGFAEAAIIARMVRASMVEVLRLDFVRTARAKGLAERIVTWRHALRNALIPVITMLGMQVGTLLGGSVIIENVFARQGLGNLATEAILKRDIPLVQGIVMVAATMYVLVNLAVDISYGFLDPRIRYE